MSEEISRIAWRYVDLVLSKFSLRNLSIVKRHASFEGRYFLSHERLCCTMGMIIDKDFEEDVFLWDRSNPESGTNVEALFKRFGPNVVQHSFRPLFADKRGRVLMSRIQKMHDNPSFWGPDELKKEHQDRLMDWMRKNFPLADR